MHDLDNDIYHIWRPDLQGVVQKAIKQKSQVTIQTHWQLYGCNTADLSLHGRFIGITGQQTQFITEQYDVGLTKNLPASPECLYTIIVDMPQGDSTGNARMEYGGRATILDQELHRNNLPLGLLLHVWAPTRIRQLRRHERHKCPEHIFAMPGLMLIDEAPTSRRKLLTLLGLYYARKSRARPVLVDISAGGVCLKTSDPGCQRFMGADDSYLFFFFSEKDEQPRFPHVFVGRKVGIFRSANSRHAGLRIKFSRELVWEEPDDELRWLDVGAAGSSSLAAMIEPDETEEAGE